VIRVRIRGVKYRTKYRNPVNQLTGAGLLMSRSTKGVEVPGQAALEVHRSKASQIFEATDKVKYW
jgi:hypothetical protein